MECFTIDDPNDRTFPFGKNTFEDPHILFHGTWSTWSSRIEAGGFVRGDLPFDWQHVGTVFRANQAIGRGSFLGLFLGDDYPRRLPPRDLFLSANFWCARAYATDAGGEVIRNTIEEADQFERVCSIPQERAALKGFWEQGLREQPQHPATRAALELLKNDEALNHIRADVKVAKNALLTLTAGGHPIVYGVRVEPKWLARDWEEYLLDWEAGDREVDIRSRADLITADRLIAKASYPNGTDQDFMPAGFSTWEQVVAFASR